MKYFTIFSLLLVIFATYTSAQRCPPRPSCRGARDVGRGGPGCRPGNVWHYDARSRQCRQMRYLGCGGNNNRHCTRASCQQRCRR